MSTDPADDARLQARFHEHCLEHAEPCELCEYTVKRLHVPRWEAWWQWLLRKWAGKP